MAEPSSEVREKARALRAEFDAAAAAAADAAALQALRDRFLGRKSGALSALLKSLGQLAEAERREAGQELNAAQGGDRAEARGARRGRSSERRREESLRRERLDVTLPGRRPLVGRRHPLTVVREELEDIFVAMGYEVYDGPEVEDDYHNFEALNMPPDHPARDMQDTFYLEGRGASSCAPTPRPRRSTTCSRTRTRPRCGSSARARCSAATATSPTRRCSSRSRGWWWGRASTSAT